MGIQKILRIASSSRDKVNPNVFRHPFAKYNFFHCQINYREKDGLYRLEIETENIPVATVHLQVLIRC